MIRNRRLQTALEDFRQRVQRHAARELDSLKVVQGAGDNQGSIERLRALESHGLFVRNDGRSVHMKSLSPSCDFCLAGLCSTLTLITQCTRRCFFCYQNRTDLAAEQAPGEGLRLEDRIYSILARKPHKAFAISGGEPLLELTDVLKAIRMVKEYDPSIRIHLYTNGDLASEDRLQQLRQAGLDEIRFNLAARNFSVEPVHIARRFFDDVLTEVPILPGSETPYREMMQALNVSGLRCLNMHELLFFGFHADKYRRRGYELACGRPIPLGEEPALPIHGSEALAFRLLEWAVESDLHYAVHYCSHAAKVIDQHRNHAITCARHIARSHELIHDTGQVEFLVVYPPDHQAAVSDLERSGASKDNYFYSQIHERLEIHPSCLSILRVDHYEVARIQVYNGTVVNLAVYVGIGKGADPWRT